MKPKIQSVLRLAWELSRDTALEFDRDRGELTAAGLAYFMLLSLAPLVLIAVAIAAPVLGHDTAMREIQRFVQAQLGPHAATPVQRWVEQATAGSGVASFIGAALALITASRFTHQLRVALNQVWNVNVTQRDGFKATLKAYVRRRLFAFVVVLASGPLLLAVFLSRALVSGLSRALFDATVLHHSAGVGVMQFFFSVVVVAAVSTVVFRFVPDTHVGWKVACIGGGVTSVLFNLGNLVIGVYLGSANLARAYGITGSLVVVLLWLYYSGAMFVFGAEFAQVWARRFGRSLNAAEQQAHEHVESRAGRADDRSATSG